MKVCTDSCLFGAWVTNLVETKIIHKPQSILDIGAGTGLLSLMLAQKINATIYSVEKDERSFNDLIKNFNESPWTQCLQAFHADIITWKPLCNFDLIISNPPFFAHDLLPENKQKLLSKHSDAFTLQHLLHISYSLINDNGTLAILLPYKRLKELMKTATDYSWHVTMQCDVSQTTDHSPFRSMFLLQKEKKEMIKDAIAIKDNNTYTKAFAHFLKDYYLAL